MRQQANTDERAWMRVMEAARQTVGAFSGGVLVLGRMLGKRRGVLRNELAPASADNRAKLGLIDAVRLMQATGDLRLMHAICLEFGYLALPLPDAATERACANTVAALARDFGELVGVYSAALMDERVTNLEFVAVTQAWGALMVAGHHLMSDVAAKNAALNKAQGIALAA